MRQALIAAALLGIAACVARTEIRAARPKAPPTPVYVGDRSCMVQDFEGATDVPDGAKNLGWVTVPESGGGDSDEDTFIALRKKICEMGGDALSQPAWVKDVDDDRPHLKANAWILP